MVNRGVLLVLVAFFACIGCTVERPNFDERLYACNDASACGEEWTCAEANVLSEDFCAAECDANDTNSCDGICTSDGACLPGCQIKSDGTTTFCPDGSDCIRANTVGDDGVCFPADGCTLNDDCEEGSICLSYFFGKSESPAISYDHYYCLQRAESGACGAGYVRTTIDETSEPLCLPPCGTPTVPNGTLRCPPALSCFTGLSEYLVPGSPDAPCIPGFIGMPCLDDSNCAFGHCLDIGMGLKACTETCAAAEELTGIGCRALEDYALSGPTLTCENDVCVPYYRIGSPCDASVKCTEGLECVKYGDLQTCSIPCDSTRDCPRFSYCTEDVVDFEGTGVCLRVLRQGESCIDSIQCESQSCIDIGGGPSCE